MQLKELSGAVASGVDTADLDSTAASCLLQIRLRVQIIIHLTARVSQPLTVSVESHLALLSLKVGAARL